MGLSFSNHRYVWFYLSMHFFPFLDTIVVRFNIQITLIHAVITCNCTCSNVFRSYQFIRIPQSFHSLEIVTSIRISSGSSTCNCILSGATSPRPTLSLERLVYESRLLGWNSARGSGIAWPLPNHPHPAHRYLPPGFRRRAVGGSGCAFPHGDGAGDAFVLIF